MPGMNSSRLAAENKQEGPDTQLLTFLAHLYDLTAVEKPCLDVVPLLPFAGWSPGRQHSALPDLYKQHPKAWLPMNEPCSYSCHKKLGWALCCENAIEYVGQQPFTPPCR